MPRVYLTTEERNAVREQQQQEKFLQKLADGLATYQNHNGLTKAELRAEAGLCTPAISKLLSNQPAALRTDARWKVFKVAGISIEKVSDTA